MEKCEGRSLYNESTIFYNWKVQFRCLNILKPDEIGRYYRGMIDKARNNMNQ